MQPVDSAARLRTAIDDASRLFAGVDEARTAVRPAPDKWCAREIIGHLIDSACNNHRRFVLGHGGGVSRWDGYEQDLWVGSQRYAEARWPDLVTLWTAYNTHLAHVMASTPADVAAREASSYDGSRQLSVGYLMDDYVRHLNHHLAQLRLLLT
jgi:hypothetical protein